MGGLAVLFIMFAYFVLTIFIMIKTPKAWGKVLVLVVAFLIPTADAMWGRYVVMPRLCKDAGLKVFRHASKADGLMASGSVRREFRNVLGERGFYDKRVEVWSGEVWLRDYGIAFVEDFLEESKSYSRLSFVNGEIIQESNVSPKAKYILSNWVSVPVPVGYGPNFVGEEVRIEKRDTAEVISRVRYYGFSGGWVERFLGRFADSGPSGVGCHIEHRLVAGINGDTLVYKTFK